MQRTISLIVTVCSIVLALCPRPVHAMPIGAAVLLGFGMSYPSGDGAAVHRGVDVACADGEYVASPLSGEVSFVGRVPSAAGGTMLAVTIVTERGNLTLMPLAEASVTRGQRVDADQRIGTVAASGDPSSAATHLHVGLKRAGMYLDPTEILQAPSPAEASIDSGADAIADAPGGGTITVPGSTGSVTAVAPIGAPVSPLQGARVGTPDAMPDGVSLAGAAPSLQATQIPLTTGAARPVSSTGRTSPTPVGVGGAVAEGTPALQGIGLPAAYSPPASPLSEAVAALADTLPQTSRVTPRGVAALVAALMAGAALLARRSLRRRVITSPVSGRLGYLLQHLKAGDTLRGLTSCPGPLPSQSRGRIAQGR